MAPGCCAVLAQQCWSLLGPPEECWGAEGTPGLFSAMLGNHVALAIELGLVLRGSLGDLYEVCLWRGWGRQQP